mmetsp:Transcript_369/g.631  ORF Transcript_369/g.631 Transcript_369/m.631 type:complete len:503 (-) Transcript_369:269-1777(-)|eukprot:CAMPEP_0198208770 /NCGR_PEP_ID=MMETSP1445-20131203/12112_1 /TAXON_ID=36898 /ORGANISM="Pyramimonas sp., Strain CCMP2087" /LENGTH=502 /DNA_ID=CAMNT_0043882305 /DNA_START=787 /DNA_END=2295 /DNA_ORIENTATION=-
MGDTLTDQHGNGNANGIGNASADLHAPLLASEPADQASEQHQASSSCSDAGVVWSRASLPLLGGGATLAFIAAVLVTVPTAFLPSELRAMGATNFVTGVAFAISPFASFVSGPVAGALCASMGPSTVLLAGVLLEGWSAILSGYVHVLCDEDRNRIVIFIICRLLQGCGGGAAYTSICVKFAEEFPQSVGEVLGLEESVAGVGYMIGPLLGSVLYNMGGFSLPFVVTGTVYLLALIPFFMRPSRAPAHHPQLQDSAEEDTDGDGDASTAARLHIIHSCADGGADAEQEGSEVRRKSTFWLVLTNTGVLTAYSVSTMTGIAIGFFSPNLQDHLREMLGLGVVGVGAMFGLPAATYIFSASLAGKVADKYGTSVVMFWGEVVLVVCYILIGPPSSLASLPMPVLWATQVGSLVGIGVGISMTVIPAMPHMLQSMHAAGIPNSTELSSGLFASSWSLGEFFGLLLGGVLTDAVGFRCAYSIVAGALALLAVVITIESRSYHRVPL